MLMSTTDILTACLGRLNTLTDAPPIAWPGINFEPPSSGLWLEPVFFPNEPADLAWEDESCHEAIGFFQVGVYYRPGGGQVEPSQMADAIIAHFPKGLEIGPVRVRKRAWQSPAVTDDGSRLYIPVTIPWRGIY